MALAPEPGPHLADTPAGADAPGLRLAAPPLPRTPAFEELLDELADDGRLVHVEHIPERVERFGALARPLAAQARDLRLQACHLRQQRLLAPPLQPPLRLELLAPQTASRRVPRSLWPSGEVRGARGEERAAEDGAQPQA